MKGYMPNLIRFSLVELDGILLGTYFGIWIGSSKCSTDGIKDDKVDGFLPGYLIGSVDTLELCNNEGAKLGLYNGKILGTKIGAVYVLEIFAFNSKQIG